MRFTAIFYKLQLRKGFSISLIEDQVMINYSEFINSGGDITGLKHSTHYYYGELVSRWGLFKVPFAINAKGNKIIIEDIEKYHAYSQEVEKTIKPFKQGKKVFATYWAHLFYYPSYKNLFTDFVFNIENAFSLYHLSVFELPLRGYCPDCGGEVHCNYKRIYKNQILKSYFSHKELRYEINDQYIEELKKGTVNDTLIEQMKSLSGIKFTRDELSEKLKELKYNIHKIDIKLRDYEIDRILFNSYKRTSEICDFSDENANHCEAKRVVAEALKSHKKVFLLRKCSLCHKIDRQPLPKSFENISLKHILPSGDKVDIAILNEENKLLAAIEVTDEQPVSEEKEKALEGIYWAELTAETVLGSNKWLVKKDRLKPFTCRDCKKKYEDMFPETVPDVPPEKELKGTGRVKLESENYVFYLNFLLKEEFRNPREMTELAVKELDKFFGFKTTEILVFYKDGSACKVYKYDYSEKLPPDKDVMWVLSFILNGETWINILDYYEQDPDYKDYVRTVKFHEILPQKEAPLYSKRISPLQISNPLASFLSILNRFFYIKNEEKICSIKHWERKFQRSTSNKYRKKQRKTYNYSMPHEDAYGSEIEKILAEALRKENIEFKSQYNLYINGKVFTISDFYIEKAKIVIYCDGFKYHYNKENVIKDRFQDRELQYLGYMVLRFTGSEIKGNIDQCIFDIKRFIKRFSE